MTIKILHSMLDRRISSRSILISTTIRDYLSLVGTAYHRRGNIEGQRDTLKTTSALRIRARMRTDVERGAVLPPVVVGILGDMEAVKNSASWSEINLKEFLSGLEETSISIID